MRTAAILYNVLLQWDHLETEYTKTEPLDPDLLDSHAGADRENQDFVLDFTLPTQRSVVITMRNLPRYKCVLHVGSEYGLRQYYKQSDRVTHF